MNSSIETFPKSKTHPMIVIGAVALVLFCGVGTAAIMGWIPTSIGGTRDAVAANMPAEAPAPHATHVAHAPSHHAAASAPVRIACANCGVVESTRELNTRAEGSGVGAAGGAVVGGLLGNQIGGGHGREAMTVLGAIGGAVAGNQIEGKVRSVRSYETTVRLENGTTRAFQQAAQPDWRSGDRVRIVDGVIRSNA